MHMILELSYSLHMKFLTAKNSAIFIKTIIFIERSLEVIIANSNFKGLEIEDICKIANF